VNTVNARWSLAPNPIESPPARCAPRGKVATSPEDEVAFGEVVALDVAEAEGVEAFGDHRVVAILRGGGHDLGEAGKRGDVDEVEPVAVEAHVEIGDQVGAEIILEDEDVGLSGREPRLHPAGVETDQVIGPVTSSTLTTLLPLAAFIIIMVFIRRWPRLSAGLSITVIGVSLLCALFLLVKHWGLASPITITFRWVVTGNLQIPFGYLLDPVSLLMLVVVTVISFLVQVYSVGYMAGDPGFSRYYAFMSLFAWAMMSLTLAPTMLQIRDVQVV